MSMKRYYDDVELVANLYPHQRKENNKWRYKNPKSKKWVHLKQSMTVDQANKLAAELNQSVADGFYERHTLPSESLLNYVNQYINYQESLDLKLKAKRSWSNRKYALRRFPDSFESVKSLTMEELRIWWDSLNYHGQKLHYAAFRKFFNWLMGKGLTPKLSFNPFSTSDDVARLLLKPKSEKVRLPCSQQTFINIKKNAGEAGYECLQIAMDISRYTTLREGDICALRWDKNIAEGCLRVVVSKSEAQKGTMRAARLSWSLRDHPLLKQYIDRARELSLINRRCPFVISHTPKRKALNNKHHLCEVTGDRLGKMFKEVRTIATTFHEIRGLSATLLKNAGNTTEEVQNIMAHESIVTTLDYMNANDLPFENVTIHI